MDWYRGRSPDMVRMDRMGPQLNTFNHFTVERSEDVLTRLPSRTLLGCQRLRTSSRTRVAASANDSKGNHRDGCSCDEPRCVV